MKEFDSELGNRLSLRRSHRAVLPLQTHESLARGFLFAAAAVMAATFLSIPLSRWVSNQSLVLLYVLTVVVTGLRHGSLPAILASLLAVYSHNYFLTEPRFALGMPHQDDLSSLVFLFLIALACGPAASRIRRQIILLRESNLYLESMWQLGQELSAAESSRDVCLATARQLQAAFQAECCLVVPGDDDWIRAYPDPASSFDPADEAAIDIALREATPAGRFNGIREDARWSVFPVVKGGELLACAALRFDPARRSLEAFERSLIDAMLRQAGETWGRIRLSGDLESARLKTEVEQLRSALLSSVSHDLKSPLSAMMGAAESLKVLDKQLPPEDRLELVDAIIQESRRLDSYIQNLLDMTRLGHGSLKIERDWVSAADIVGAAVSRLKRYFPGVRTDFHPEGSALLLYVNPDLMEQALFNILENAVRFSPPEEAISIRVEGRGDACVISIEDRGPGIPASLREKIFDMFYVAQDGDQKKQNTGMGLAICKGMVTAHGGKVRALQGSGGRGTRFVVELPLGHPDNAAGEAEISEEGR